MSDKDLLIKIKGIDELTPVLMKAIASMEASATKLAESVDKLQPAANKAGASTKELDTKSINLASTLNIVKMGIDAATAAWGYISAAVNHAVEEALAAERALTKVTGALVSQGLYSKKAADGIHNYAEEIEKMTGVSAEAVQEMIAMGVQMGLSVEKSKEMEAAARKLAFATGSDVTTAFRQLQGAMNGQTRGLMLALPGVKDLTEAQLKNGAAIDFVNKKLTDQYTLYLGSFEAGLKRAESSVSNVYKAFGQIIVQNPMVIKGINLFTQAMGEIQKVVESAGRWITENEAAIERFGKALVIAAAIVTAASLVIATFTSATAIATAVSTAFGAAITFLTGPLGLALLAIAAITAAFYKWPGLFDQIVGSLKVMVGIFLSGLGDMASMSAKLVGIFNKDLAKSLDNVSKNLETQANDWKKVGFAQFDVGTQANATADIVDASIKKQNNALQSNIDKTNEQNAALKNRHQLFQNVDMGTDAQRKSLAAQASDRDKELKDFETWLENKQKVAVSKELSQQSTLAKLRADSLKDSTGPQAAGAKGSVEIKAEEEKQAILKMRRNAGILDEQQYQEALLTSQRKYAMLKMQQAQEEAEAIAAIKGTSEEAFQVKLANQDAQFQAELAQRLQQADIAGANTEQHNAIELEMNAQHIANKTAQEEQFYLKQAQMLEASGNQIDAYHARVKAAQVRQGTVLGALSATTNSEEYKATNTAFNNLGTLRNTKNKKLFELGKAAAIAGAIMSGASAAVAAFAPPPQGAGPLFGGILAATIAAATAVQIANISAQKFEGGQADQGMDSIPGALSGKSFVLSQGERVVQPTANKDLTDFLTKEKGGNGGGAKAGQVINITLNYGGMGTPGDARAMAEILVKEIRTMSERGQPILSKRGLVE